MVTRMQSSIFRLYQLDCTFPVGITEAEIDQSDGLVIVNQQVLWFKVSVDDIQLMDILDSSYDLLEDGARFRLRNSACYERYLHESKGTFCT